MKRVFFYLSIVLLLVSCNKNKVYFSDSVSFEETGYWERFDHVNFDVPIEKTNFNYDLVLDIEYDSKIDYDIIPLHVIMNTLDGEERIREFKIRIKDGSGTHRGEQLKSGNYVISHVIRQNFSMSEPNSINVDIENFYPKFQIPYIKNISIKLIKTNYVPKKTEE